MKPYGVEIADLLSRSCIYIGIDSFSTVEKLLRSFHIWCDAPESVTHFRAAASAQAVSQKRSQSSVVASAAVAVAVFTLDHFFMHLNQT